jgi:hypothetical protein
MPLARQSGTPPLRQSVPSVNDAHPETPETPDLPEGGHSATAAMPLHRPCLNCGNAGHPAVHQHGTSGNWEITALQ